MKKKMILLAFLLLLVGCTNVKMELKAYVEIEAGTEELKAESFFENYVGQEMEFLSTLTSEQLKTVGNEYKISVLYLGEEHKVTIKIVDTTAPVIMGVRNLYIFQSATISYRTGITVEDNSGEQITLEVDSSAVDIYTPGEYQLWYSATDASGNVTTEQAKVSVTPINEETILPYVQNIVDSLVTEDMTQWEKAWVLYDWCRTSIRYGAAGDRTTIWHGVYEGAVRQYGDCYVYYATYSVMLDLVGIPNMQVSRVGGTSNHWWCLVNLGDGWYHCDSSPRTLDDPYICFMQTDEQIEEYTTNYLNKPNYYTFDTSLYPERGTVIVFDGADENGNKTN